MDNKSFETAKYHPRDNLSEQADEIITTRTAKKHTDFESSQMSDHVSAMAVIDGRNTRAGKDILYQNVKGFKP